MTAADLIAFEAEVAARFGRGEIHAPVHLSGGNEQQLIRIFKDIKRNDWVFCSYRQHYHAILHGIRPEAVMAEIMAGRSMTMQFPEHRFFSSAIVAGQLPIAVGVAAGIKRRVGTERVWCFCGDMAAAGGTFYEAARYVRGHKLPLTFWVEDNGLSCESPTLECWGRDTYKHVHQHPYRYNRAYPHYGIGKNVSF